MKKNNITPFIESFKSGKTISVNGKNINIALYNAIISKRDLGLWKVGMKPHRHWKVTDVKKFFGFTGNDKEKLYLNICDLIEEFSNINIKQYNELNNKKVILDIEDIDKMKIIYQTSTIKELWSKAESKLINYHAKYGTVDTETIRTLMLNC